MNKFKSVLTVLLAVIFVFGFTIASFVLPDEDISVAENRSLAKFPVLSGESLLKGEFMKGFESYTQDQFPLRNTFRKLKSDVVFNVFMQKDNNGYFTKGDYIFKNNNVLNFENIEANLNKINFYYENLITEKNKVYLSIIPDKNYYLNDKIALRLDYEKLFSLILDKLNFAEYIDITDKLSLDSYYATDTHWRQEKILDVADYILEEMGTKNSGPDMEEVSTGKHFNGVYARQTTFDTKGDLMKYLTGPLLNEAILTDYSTGIGKETPIYNLDKIDSDEPYDMFMSYAKVGLVTLERKELTTGKELVVFRDSFGSSIGPLLLNGYDKITFIDMREANPQAIKLLVEFKDSDVLLLYSTSVINDTDEMN